MEIVSFSPFQHASFRFRQSSGEWAQAVICKATYVLVPGLATLAPEQEPANEDDNHWNDDVSRSLYAPSDYVFFKPRADVMLVGSAFAPGLVPVSSLKVRLVVAGIDKSLEVIGDRTNINMAMAEPARFAAMPLRYERAVGGPDTWNPVGCSPRARPDAHGAIRLPNLLVSTNPSALSIPAGLGPIAANWPSRVVKLGSSANQFAGMEWRDKPFPEGVDLGFFNAAPQDQQVQSLRDDERISLENLHREHPRFTTMLPGVHPRAFVESAGVLRQEIKLTCDTLWIDSDRSICTLTWRGVLPLSHPDEIGRIAIAKEGRSERLSRADIERLLGIPVREGHPSSNHTEITLQIGADGDDKSFVDGTLQLSKTQQQKASKPAPTSPAWLGAAPPERPQAPTPIAAPPVPPLPAPPPVRAAVISNDKPLSTPTESPWAAMARPAIAPPLPMEPIAAPVQTVAEPILIPAKSREIEARVIEMLWLDPKYAPKILKNAAWKKLLPESKPRKSSDDDNDNESAVERKESKDRRNVAFIFKGADAALSNEIEEVLEESMADGVFSPAMVLTGGEIEFPFDERKTLEATLAIAAPFAAADKSLKDATDKAVETPADRLLCDKLTARIREVFAISQKSLPAGYLVSQSERMLLEERHYQKRTLLGQKWIRTLLTMGGATIPMPTYVPESLAEELPLMQRFPVKLIAEIRPALDQYEAHPYALRVLAIARLVSFPRRTLAK